MGFSTVSNRDILSKQDFNQTGRVSNAFALVGVVVIEEDLEMDAQMYTIVCCFYSKLPYNESVHLTI